VKDSWRHQSFIALPPVQLYKVTAGVLSLSARLDPARYPDALAARSKRAPKTFKS